MPRVSFGPAELQLASEATSSAAGVGRTVTFGTDITVLL